jgi:hypothetical protein
MSISKNPNMRNILITGASLVLFVSLVAEASLNRLDAKVASSVLPSNGTVAAAALSSTPSVEILANGYKPWISLVASDNAFRIAIGPKNETTPSVIKSFKPIKISWSSKNVKSCSVEGRSGTSGSFMVNELTGDKTYTVTCQTADVGAVTSSVKLLAVRLEVRANGQRGSLTATAGSTINLSWTSTHTSNCQLMKGKGTSGSVSQKVIGLNFRYQGSCTYFTTPLAKFASGYVYDDVLVIPKKK